MTVMTPARTSARLVFVLLAIGSGAFAMLQSLISPVLPTIQADLHTTQSGIAWVLIAWLLSASVATPIVGRVGDMIGKDRALLLVLGAIALGGLVSALAPDLAVMIVGRIIQGLGGAIYPIAFGILRDEVEPRRVPSAIGAMSGVVAVGGGVGTVLAGPITQALGWRALFWIPLVVVVIVALLCRRLVPESPVRSNGRIDWVPSTLLAAWLVALLLPVSQGRAWGWGAPLTLALFGVAVAAFVAWIVAESRAADPVVDMRMMRRPAVWTTNLVALLFGAGMFATVTFLPQLIQTPPAAGYGFGASVTLAGVVMLPMLVTMAVGGTISGPIHGLVGFKAQLASGSALLGLGALGFASWSNSLWHVAVAGAVVGLGLGLAYAAMTSVIVQAVGPAQTGVATGMNANIRNIGGAVGTAVVAAVVTGTVQPSGFPAAAGYTNGFLVLAATAAVATAFSLLIPAARHHNAG